MSDSSDEDDQRKAESTCRMWVESQPGPSRCQPSRQGYCGYCRVLYSNLDQHLSSLRHLDSVRASSRGSSTVSSANSSRTKLTLLERFLQDVLQHHPHHYNDPRPSHADLPSVSAPPLPREELDELRFSDDDSRSLGTREHLPSSDNGSCQPPDQQEDNRSQSGKGDGAGQERLSAPISEPQEGRPAPAGHTPSSNTQTPPPVHRKAHRKTNRRKSSGSSSSSRPHRGPDLGPRPPPQLRPWLSWQKERREVRKQEAFSDRMDPLDQTIQEVIQRCCYGVSSTACQQEEAESFHLSLPVSTETQSDDWDSPVQVVLQRGQTLSDTQPPHTPVQVTQVEEQDLSRLMDVQVDLDDQVYSYQLDSALHSEWRAGGGATQEEGFWTLPIDKVLPAPAHIPESFRGKTWAQIEQEDEEKVDRLVRQFRRERFICYFDTESLARYGRRSQKKKEAEPDSAILPLLDHNEDESAHARRRRKNRRAFRVASRCQVVKVSHSTQTVRLVVPAVRRPASEAPLTCVPAANQDAAERTPDVQTWRCLPPSYSNIVTPLQPRTTVVYLLCSPSVPDPSYTSVPSSTPKRCRKKRRPLDLQGLKVKYKRLPVRFYDPSSNRILKNPPKSFLWSRGSAPANPPPTCVRQLFRSLSPDLNTDRSPGEGAAGSSRVRGQRSDATFSHANRFLLSTLSRDSAQTDKQDTVRRRSRMAQAPPPPPHSRSERGRGGRTRPPPSTRRTRAQATPPQPRREGLRRAGPGRKVPGPSPPPLTRRGRARRGRGCERGRR